MQCRWMLTVNMRSKISPKLLAVAEQHPAALISGQPIYDDSIPRSRLYGRWVTHVWVSIETLSLQLKDSMCGFRVYPVAPTLQLAKHAPSASGWISTLK